MIAAHALHNVRAFVAHTAGEAGGVALVLFLLVYVGVILPTVWSRHPYRRAAAHRTLTTLMSHLDTALHALVPRRRR